jgi:hypothetical protein
MILRCLNRADLHILLGVVVLFGCGAYDEPDEEQRGQGAGVRVLESPSWADESWPALEDCDPSQREAAILAGVETARR